MLASDHDFILRAYGDDVRISVKNSPRVHRKRLLASPES
jgi:hypothetical protein